MTAVDAMPGDPPRAMWFDLPTGARDWVETGGRYAFYLPRVLAPHDVMAGRERLHEWDALAGRLLREAWFGLGETREMLRLAEAVAAVAESLAVALGDSRP